MILLYSGAATLLAGSTVVTIFRFRVKDKTIEAFLGEIKPLTASGASALANVSEQPAMATAEVSPRDMQTLFLNSRLWIKVGNRARLCVPDDLELKALFILLQEDHRKLRLLLILSVIEKFFGKLGLGCITMYASVLLWTYAEELEILNQISDKCDPKEGTAIRAVL